MNHPTTIAVDLAKSVFEVAVSQRPGRVCRHRRLSRAQMVAFFRQEPPATVLWRRAAPPTTGPDSWRLWDTAYCPAASPARARPTRPRRRWAQQGSAKHAAFRQNQPVRPAPVIEAGWLRRVDPPPI